MEYLRLNDKTFYEWDKIKEELSGKGYVPSTYEDMFLGIIHLRKQAPVSRPIDYSFNIIKVK